MKEILIAAGIVALSVSLVAVVGEVAGYQAGVQSVKALNGRCLP